ELSSIQSKLFDLGAELAATSPESLGPVQRIRDEDVVELESAIDRLDADLPALRNFVLPAGTTLAAALHAARPVCRRAARRVVALGQDSTLDTRLVRYLNRRADLLFVMARWSNRRAGVDEVEWRGARAR